MKNLKVDLNLILSYWHIKLDRSSSNNNFLAWLRIPRKIISQNIISMGHLSIHWNFNHNEA